MSKNIYCPMIHGGLNINLKTNSGVMTHNQCCLSTSELNTLVDSKILWNSNELENIRDLNNQNIWNPGCWECERLEQAGVKSFRISMIDKFGIKEKLSGPQRIDMLFDRSCNLACRSCGPRSSTLWEKHLRDNNLPVGVFANNTNENLRKITDALKSMDLSNLEMVQFCGGETLLGNTYWQAAQLIADIAPDYVNKIELGFQTNGTQPIDEKYYPLIEKFKLVKFMVSIDGTYDKFEYLRWPASWNQFVDNIFALREKLPGNVMFFVQETTNCLNLLHFNDVTNWVNENFNSNRFGDPTDCTTQLIQHQYLDVNNITQEYVDALQNTRMSKMLRPDWMEIPGWIQSFIRETEKFDKIRGQDWKKTFPEVANLYSRYLNK